MWAFHCCFFDLKLALANGYFNEQFLNYIKRLKYISINRKHNECIDHYYSITTYNATGTTAMVVMNWVVMEPCERMPPHRPHRVKSKNGLFTNKKLGGT